MKVALVLGLAAVLLTTWYMVNCAFWPYANCPRCKGGGRKRSPSGRNWRRCRRCSGSGGRLRVGRRIWNWYQSSR